MSSFKIATSYFYQIRFFPKNYIPVSTAIFDPGWFHAELGPHNIFVDKRGIVNGIRILPIIECGKAASSCKGPDQCSDKQAPPHCNFLKTYRENLDQLNFKDMYEDIERLANEYKERYDIEDEIVIVLIVYETPKNPCSERIVLQQYFRDNGVECNELEYPLEERLKIKKGDFDF